MRLVVCLAVVIWAIAMLWPNVTIPNTEWLMSAYTRAAKVVRLKFSQRALRSEVRCILLEDV